MPKPDPVVQLYPHQAFEDRVCALDRQLGLFAWMLQRWAFDADGGSEKDSEEIDVMVGAAETIERLRADIMSLMDFHGLILRGEDHPEAKPRAIGGAR